MGNGPMGARLGAVLLLALLLLTGCGGVPLYTNMPEQTVNEMLALLLDHGVAARKKPGEKGTWDLMVDDGVFASAMDVLSANGYPREGFESVGDAYKRQGLVSSPREERARFLHALSRSLAQTISQIDGVLSARVHLVVPEPNPLLDTQLPSSAAVFVKHSRESQIDGFIPQIKQLVQNSIQGLAYEKISVVLFPSDEPRQTLVPLQEPVSILGIRVLTDSVGPLRWVLGAALALVLVSWTGLAWLLLRWRKGGGEG